MIDFIWFDELADLVVSPATLGKALAEWNRNEPAWTRIKKFEELTAAQRSRVVSRAKEIELAELMDCLSTCTERRRSVTLG